jgi:hypothetical protein
MRFAINYPHVGFDAEPSEAFPHHLGRGGAALQAEDLITL